MMCAMSWLFGESKRAVRRQVAQQHDGVIVRAPAGRSIVVSNADQWQLLFDFESPDGPPNPLFGQRTVTQIGIPFTLLDHFTWTLRRRPTLGQAIYQRRKKWTEAEGYSWEEFIRRLQPQLRPPAVPLGYGDFDYEFDISTSDEGKLRELFSDPDLRRFVQGMPSVSLSALQDDDWLYSLGSGEAGDLAVLSYQHPGVLKDDAKLRDILRLLETIIERLAAMRVAEPTRHRLFPAADVDRLGDT